MKSNRFEEHSCEPQGLQARLVHIVDDDEGLREALAILLGTVGYDARCYDCASCFLDAIVEPQGVILLDIRLPGLSGLRLIEKMQLPRPGLEVVFISGTADVADAVTAMKAGVHDFLVKPFRDQELLDAVDSAWLKASDSHHRATDAMVVLNDYTRLSPAEQGIAPHLARGLLTKQIAALTGRSENTIKVHRSRIKQKMRAQTNQDLIRKLGEIIPVAR